LEGLAPWRETRENVALFKTIAGEMFVYRMDVHVSVATAKAKRRKPISQSRKSAQKREAIVRAAIEIINAKSYALATMSEIAAALDLRDATLYLHLSASSTFCTPSTEPAESARRNFGFSSEAC
jgi:hypothetical protein